MKVDPKPILIENQDETFSYTGKKDFYVPEGDVRSIGPPNTPRSRPRTRSSQNNSYT